MEQTACHRCRRYAIGKYLCEWRAIQTAAMRVENFFLKNFSKTEIPCTNDQQRHRNDEGIQTKGRPRPEDWLGEPYGEGEKKQNPKWRACRKSMGKLCTLATRSKIELKFVFSPSSRTNMQNYS